MEKIGGEECDCLMRWYGIRGGNMGMGRMEKREEDTGKLFKMVLGVHWRTPMYMVKKKVQKELLKERTKK